MKAGVGHFKRPCLGGETDLAQPQSEEGQEVATARGPKSPGRQVASALAYLFQLILTYICIWVGSEPPVLASWAQAVPSSGHQ